MLPTVVTVLIWMIYYAASELLDYFIPVDVYSSLTVFAVNTVLHSVLFASFFIVWVFVGKQAIGYEDEMNMGK